MNAPDSGGALRDISDTALWVAVYRAMESEKPRPLFRDPYARRLAGARGEEVLRTMRQAKTHAWAMIIRTHSFDQFVLDRIAQGADLVVNLAAGLDTRPYRMALPPGLDWVEVDLPRMIEYKSEILRDEKPVCRLERVALDLADVEARRALLQRLGGRGRRALVLTEGLLIYLESGQVATLATDLGGIPAFRWWVTDLASPGLLERMRKTWGEAVARAGAPFRFAPEEGPAFFERFGWRALEVRSAFHAAGRAGVLPWFLRPFMIFPERKTWNPKQVWSGHCLLERA